MKITKKSNISEIVEKHPEAISVLFEKGIHCVGCHAAAFETLEQGLKAHGLSEEDMQKVVDELNKKIEEQEKEEKKEKEKK